MAHSEGLIIADTSNHRYVLAEHEWPRWYDTVTGVWSFRFADDAGDLHHVSSIHGRDTSVAVRLHALLEDEQSCRSCIGFSFIFPLFFHKFFYRISLLWTDDFAKQLRITGSVKGLYISSCSLLNKKPMFTYKWIFSKPLNLRLN